MGIQPFYYTVCGSDCMTDLDSSSNFCLSNFTYCSFDAVNKLSTVAMCILDTFKFVFLLFKILQSRSQERKLDFVSLGDVGDALKRPVHSLCTPLWEFPLPVICVATSPAEKPPLFAHAWACCGINLNETEKRGGMFSLLLSLISICGTNEPNY